MGIIQTMKVHNLPPARAAFWDHDSPSLSLGCKRFRLLAPKHPPPAAAAATFESFIRPECGPRKTLSSDFQKKEPPQQVETGHQAGGTRWNPTQEQIGILEMLYRSGMRTPNAQQIEQITGQLSNYGKIEGKNVFYWFQNHKARERQKQKRNSLGLAHSPRTPPSPFASVASLFSPTSTKDSGAEEESVENNPFKRKCMSWGFDQCSEEDKSYCTEEGEGEGEEAEGEDRTLKLFPLHPEGSLCCRD